MIIIPGDWEPRPEPEPEPDRYIEIQPEAIAGWVAGAIEQNRRVRRDCRSQEALDACIEVLHEEGETYMAAALLHLMSLRIAGHHGLALSLLIEAANELATQGGLDRRCRVCGCTQEHACEGGCEWVEFDLCSACDRKLKAATTRAMGPGPGRDG